MAKAGRRRQRGSKRRRGAGQSRGAVLGVLLLVCAGAVAWYFRSALVPGPAPDKPAPVAPAGPSAATPGDGPPPAADETERFEFYDLLPDAEVEVTEQPRAAGGVGPPPVSVPGTYVIQAGAFPAFAEADRVKARLALLGITSRIQEVEANGARFHRVRIGPIDNLDELNRLRGRLRQNGIEYLVIPVGD